jgi:hypothetical protein
MQLKNSPVARGEHLQGSHQGNPIETASQSIIVPPALPFGEPGTVVFTVFVQRYLAMGMFAKMHQGGVHCETVQPRGQCGLASKRRELPECLNKDFLGQVIRFCRVVRHPQTDCEHTVLVQMKEGCECICVSLQCFTYQIDL